MSKIKEQLLIETFENEFNLQRYKSFINEFFNGPKLLNDNRMTGIWKEYSDHIKAYYTIAKYTDKHNNNLLVLAVELERDSSIDRARSMQRNFVSKILDDYNLESAIVAFYTEGNPSWRLSYVRLDYTFGESGLELELTPARRYSYLVGVNEPNHTALKQLYPIFADDIKSPTINEIEEAFSVEKVTRDFFDQYKEKYFELKEYLETDKDFIEETKALGLDLSKFSEQFSKKLLGQLVFLYFIQKKGWLGVKIVPKRILKNEFIQIKENLKVHQSDILEKVYTFENNAYILDIEIITNNSLTDHQYGILSDIFIDTRFAEKWGDGYQGFIREVLWRHCQENNKNFFLDYLEPFFYDALNKERKNHYSNVFNCRIPFLNGGLFEPIESYNWRDTKFNIPNSIFSNINVKGKNADGILDVFDRFNFTMNEAEPLEKDVAIDPEMLGKIFEELLEVSDRKSKGAFYTPREIVHYMCQESLVNYLTNEVDVPYNDLKEFVLYGDLIRDADSRIDVGYSKKYTIKDTILNNIVSIDNALKNVKVADPAVGSGAFPLGMLNEIVRLRKNITDYLVILDKQNQLDRIYGENLIREKRSQYDIKWETIKNCIFAVDIEPSAVDITKLRLWLSVVVDQEINKYTPEPHVLPNLDMNIHVGNSLVDEYEGIKLFDKKIFKNSKKDTKNNKKPEFFKLMFYNEDTLNSLIEHQSRYFDEKDTKTKESYKQLIKSLQDQLIMGRLQEKNDQVNIDKYLGMKSKNENPFFIWELEFSKVFKEKGGFDIIIGNPPYVGESGNKELFRPIASTDFGKKFYQGKMDLFYFFFHNAIDIGNEKAEISFITTNYYPTAFGARNLRYDISDRTYIRSLIDFNELKIFESATGQHNMITMLTKNKEDPIKIKTSKTNRVGSSTSDILNNITSGFDSMTDYFVLEQNNIYEGEEKYIRLMGVVNDQEDSIGSILSKIENNSELLGSLVNINQGVVSGADYVSGRNYKKLKDTTNILNMDGIFVLDLENNRDLNYFNSLNKLETKLFKPFFKNSEIQKFNCNLTPSKYLLYLDKSIDTLAQYPNVKRHIDKYKDILIDRREVKSGKIKYFQLQWPREEGIFLDEKIVVPYRTKNNNFAYNAVDWFCRSDVYVITNKENIKNKENTNLKYLLGLLNSSTYYTWLYFKGKRKGKILELFRQPLSEIPIRIPESDFQDEIVEIVDIILELDVNSETYKSKLNHYLNLINNKVFNLFNFSDKERDIINKLYSEIEET